jgi:signal transduction histidine kinase
MVPDWIRVIGPGMFIQAAELIVAAYSRSVQRRPNICEAFFIVELISVVVRHDIELLRAALNSETCKVMVGW